MSKDGHRRHAGSHHNHGHAARYDARVAHQRFERPVAEHKPAELSSAERTKLLVQMETNPEAFKQRVQLWRAQNPKGKLELGDANAYSTIVGMDFTKYKPEDLERVAFTRIEFKGAKFANPDQVAAFDDCDTYYSGIILGSEQAVDRPKPTQQQMASMTARARVEQEAAAINAMMRSGR